MSHNTAHCHTEYAECVDRLAGMSPHHPAIMPSMNLLHTALVATVLVAPLASQSAPTYQERDFLTRIRRLTVEGKRAGEGYWSPDGKRLVFQSEREPGNPVLSDLRTGSRDRRHQAHLDRPRQDHVRVLPAGHRRDRVCLDARGSEIEAATRTRSSRSARRAKNGATRGTTTPRWTSTPTTRRRGAMKRLTTATRLRRRRQLLARRPVDRLLVDARAPTTVRSPTRRRSSSRRIRATSPRSTSCAPTARSRSASPTCGATTAARSSPRTASKSCGGASTNRG